MILKYIIAGKNLFDYTNLFSPNIIKMMTRWYINDAKTNMAEENTSLDFRFKKNDKKEVIV